MPHDAKYPIERQEKHRSPPTSDVHDPITSLGILIGRYLADEELQQKPPARNDHVNINAAKGTAETRV
jgi:hypothetical protein